MGRGITIEGHLLRRSLKSFQWSSRSAYLLAPSKRPVSLHVVCARCPTANLSSPFPSGLRIYFRFDRRFWANCAGRPGRWCGRWSHFSVADHADAVPGMVGAIQTFGQLIHGHPHIHALVTEGVFLPETAPSCRCLNWPPNRSSSLWEQEVFELLLAEGKITEEVVANIRSWKHSGFSVDQSVRVEAKDTEGLQRLIEYFLRCPFSQARMIEVTGQGRSSTRPETTGWDASPKPAARNCWPGPRAISRSSIPWIFWPRSPSTFRILGSI